ncbi:PH domain-containing protein [Microbacterium sp. NPDC091313]
MPRVVFRSTFNRVLSIVAWAVIVVLLVGALVVPGLLGAAPGLILGAASVAVLVWVLLWSPSLAVDDEGVTVVNVLAEHVVPWAALIHVDTRFALTLVTPQRRISSTAAPAPGAVGTLRAARAQRRSESASLGPRPGDLPGTDSGTAAQIVRERWEALRETGRIEAGVADTTAVRTRPRALAIALIVVSVTGLVTAVLLH